MPDSQHLAKRPHWACKYIGLPCSLGARGPTQVDCWGLLCLVYANEYRIELPRFPGIALCPIGTISATLREAAQSDWSVSSVPFDGAAVGMSIQKALHHVGVFTEADGGKIIHAWERRNVVADTVAGLRQKGFRTITFFKHKSWPL